MPRAIWTGSVAFGLVNVPVRMFGAIEEHTLHFHYVHEPDGSRIGYRKVCKAEDRPVPEDEIVKAFEFEKGEYVYVRDEDFEAAAAEQEHKTIDIRAFAPYEQIDPIYFERTYYLAPQAGGEKVYALLARAMAESGLAALAKFVMRDRQNLACLRVRDGVLTLERMHFADEIRPAGEFAPDDAGVEKQELAMARRLIEQYTGEFDPGQFRDTYRDALCEIIEAKRRGEEVVVPETREPEAPTDLMAALRASVEAAQGRRSGRPERDGGTARRDLGDLSKDELYGLAKDADIPGRTQMTKDELIDALQAA
jgi:DNA end-binding protein Ku